MTAKFLGRLRKYYADSVTELTAKAQEASVLSNPTDKGLSRERAYASFLKRFLPSACNVVLGGFVFNQQGEESAQIDIIVTSDTCPQFKLAANDKGEKSFACVDGTIAVAAVKSNLDTAELHDALKNIASIPQHSDSLEFPRVAISIPHYDQWPYKIVYAHAGVTAETLNEALSTYYQSNPCVPQNRRPDMIHVPGKYCFRRSSVELEYNGRKIPRGTFFHTTNESDAASVAIAVHHIQQALLAARHILYRFDTLYNNMFDIKR